MARICDVSATVLNAPLERPWDFGIEPYAASSCVLVVVESESGERGFGEAIARKSARTTATLVTDFLRPLALGRDVADAGNLWYEAMTGLRRWGHSRGFLWEAISGLDIALWDLRARELGVPLAKLLPFGNSTTVDTYASSIYFQRDVATAVEVAQDVVADGHQRVKIKIGHRPEHGGLQRDIRTVRAIREAVDPRIDLMLDANGAYSLAEARILVDALRGLGLLWLEEPLPPDDLSGYEALAAISPIPLAAGESEFGVLGFRDLLARRCIDYVQPDISRCGGFTGAVQIASLCFAYNVRLCPHTGFSGGINNLASLHLAGSVPDPGLLEFMIINNPLRDLFVEELPVPDKGRITVPQTHPGLGFQLSEDKVATFTVPTAVAGAAL